MSKTCGELFADARATILGNPGEKVCGLAYRSDAVKPGDAFFCIVGTKVDGHSFAQDAVDRGASVIVAERRLNVVDTSNVTVVMVDDSRRAMAEAACAFYDDPSSSFQLVGVTGTNGKTTVTYLLESIMKKAGFKTGVIGTIECRVGDEVVESDHTTPESVDLQRLFAHMRDAGCQVVVMEVSSHALDLMRPYGSHFAVTAFTNLTRDHLDYHRTFNEYFAAKSRLFGSDYPAKRAICDSSEWGRLLVESCREAGDEVMTFGEATSDVSCRNVKLAPSGTQVDLCAQGEVVHAEYPLVGGFNVENVECATTVALELGVGLFEVADALSCAVAVPGRMQPVTTPGSDVTVIVDYAHTPDALKKAIDAARAVAPKAPIWLVFGCEGDRDRTKRPIMGEIALSADHVMLTDDSPHSERSEDIFEEVLAGMGARDEAAFELVQDRREAMFKTLRDAPSGACVLIAGRGHEATQKTNDGPIPFLDADVALEALERRMVLKGKARHEA